MYNNIHQLLILDEFDDVANSLIDYNKNYYSENFSSYSYFFWSEESLVSLIKNNFEPEILDAFFSLKPHAYKSDLARLCILYVHGGWYADMHTQIYDLPKVTKSALLFTDRDFVVQTPNTIANSLFYSEPKNLFLYKCIKQICKNIEENYFGITPFCPTGPNLYGDVFFNQITNKEDFQLGYCTDIDNGESSPTFGYYYIINNKKVGIAKNAKSKFLNIKSYSNYKDLWSKKDIYIVNKTMKTININEYPAVYINMDTSVVKNKKMQQNLKKICGFTNIKRVRGGIGKDKIHGVSIGHYNALSTSKSPVIVFEDDCEVLNYVNTIDIPDDADALYLGIMPWGMKNGASTFNAIQYKRVNYNSDIYRVYNLLGAHAILYLSERFFNFAREECKKASITGEFQDILLANSHKNFNIYAVGTPMFYQSGYYEQQTNKHITEYINYTHEDLTKDFKGKWSWNENA